MVSDSKKDKKRRAASYEPTPSEIRRACDKILDGLTQEQLDKKSGKIKNQHWTPDIISSIWINDNRTYLED